MASERSAKLRFPIIRRIEIRDYPMYPGVGDGLEHKFVPGVNAIVGINGIGKTTLLNVLLRMIVGPFDPRKADVQEPGAKLHELTELKRFNYFSARIGGDARQSIASIELSFGSNTVRVVRDLGPKLEIKELWQDGVRIVLGEDADLDYEDRYLELISELSGINSRYDFDFVVRNLLFFLEDKVPLIWNPKGQFEILRILFLEEKLSAATAVAHDKLMQVDSQYRNLTWMVNKLREQHTQALASLQAAPEEIVTLDAARKAFEASESNLQALEQELSKLTEMVESAKATAFSGEQAIDDISRQLEQVEVSYLRRSFPDLPSRIELVLGSLLASGECPACGSTNKAATSRIRALLSRDQCPCCESVVSSDLKTPGISKSDAKDISDLEVRLRALRAENDRARKQVLLLEQEHAETREALYRTQRERAELRHRVHTLESSQGPTTEDFDRLTEGLRQQERQVSQLRDARAGAQAEYDKLLERARRRISSVADAIVKSFRSYAKNFLIEDSQLAYQLHKRQVGEGGLLMSFPSFVLTMSSGAAPTGSVRENADQVSESQKEFVDLAFRMAILEVCSKQSGPGMLVIETPEASLDSLFIARAGELLRQFAEGSDPRKTNVVIATTNLNKENMLGHLLGIVRRKVRSGGQQEALSQRVLNLLEVAAQTRAYKDNKRMYDKAYVDALGFNPK